MTWESETTQLSTQERRKQLRQLEHDLRNYLGVVSTGMEALTGARDEPEMFSELHQMIEQQGIEPLKKVIADMITVACATENG
ncbi:hypothetical protein [Thalassoroseus pseudoceratinae]|uniref:hypothetical protein n=1 Tax=Thalassoroseus pseudoceratinae TaxID=2713176 RepID=UPI001420545C|nr:hypothetical protein [Thalassoroseus pseudoceratinae]